MSNGTLTPPVGPEDHGQGSEHAPVTLVEYGDFECPHCGRAHPVVQQLQRELGDALRFVFRHFPLREAHPHAEHAAEAAESAAARGGEEAFWEMHDLMFENQEALNDESLLAYAEAAGVDQTAVAADSGGWDRRGACASGFPQRRAQRRQRHPDFLRQRPALRRQLDGRRELCRRPAGAGSDAGVALTLSAGSRSGPYRRRPSSPGREGGRRSARYRRWRRSAGSRPA